MKFVALENGLTANLVPIGQMPAACFLIGYKVGSADDSPGKRGISHFLEHMMFGGTPAFPSCTLEKWVSACGGKFGAVTSTDYTFFYTLIPGRHVDIPVRIEADRMHNVLFENARVDREKQIILTERRISRANPMIVLRELIVNHAFIESPYKHPVIGYEEDILSIDSSSLEDHYRRFYQPNRAFVTVVGQFDQENLIHELENHFGLLSAPQSEPTKTAQEPRQTGLQRSVVVHPRLGCQLALAWKWPPANHPDAIALELINILLGGAPAFVKGEGKTGTSSSMLRTLVENGTVRDANCSILRTKQPDLFMVTCPLNSADQFGKTESALRNCIERLKERPVSDEALQDAIAQALRQHALAKDDLVTHALELSRSVVRFGDASHWRNYTDKLMNVTPEQIMKAAQNHLTDHNCTIIQIIPSELSGFGISVPSTPPGLQGSNGTKPTHSRKNGVSIMKLNGMRAAFSTRQDRKPPIIVESRIDCRKHENGLTTILYNLSHLHTVAVQLVMPAGAIYDPVGKEGLSFMNALLFHQTLYDSESCPDRLGIFIDFKHRMDTVTFTATCMKDRFPDLSRLLLDNLLFPRYEHQTFSFIKQLMIHHKKNPMIGRWLSKTEFFPAALYPEGHPLCRSPDGTLESLSNIGFDDILQFHSQHYSAKESVFVLVGDVEQEWKEHLVRFTQWKGTSGRIRLPAIDRTKIVSVHAEEYYNPNSLLAEIAFHWLAVERNHPDYLAMDVLAALLGKKDSAYGGRLNKVLRDTYGLSYHQHVDFPARSVEAPFTIWAGTYPELADRVVELIHEEVRKLRSIPVSQEELHLVCSYLSNRYHHLLSNPSAIAKYLAQCAFHNLKLDYINDHARFLSGITAHDLQRMACVYLSDDRLFIQKWLPTKGE